MERGTRPRFVWRVLGLLIGGWIGATAAPLPADTITLRNGMQVQGEVGKIAKLAENPLNAKNDKEASTPIVFVNDMLRRTYFPSRQIRADGLAAGGINQQRIRIDKRVAMSGKRIGAVGPVIKITPFDTFGNRSYTMNTPQGPLTIIQGITEVTPLYTRVEGMHVQNPYVWDMRVATTTIPRETLSAVLRRQLDPMNADQQLQIVRLYTQAERFEDAREELSAIIAAFPMLAELKKQEQELFQLSAGRLLREVELRRRAGQYDLAYQMLKKLPEEGLADETMIRKQELLKEFEEQFKLGQETVKLIESLQSEVANAGVRRQLDPAVREIKNQLNFHTLPRMADFVRLADNEGSSAEQKVALAVSGWLLGNGNGIDNLSVALSSLEVRDLLREYLRTKDHAERLTILEKLQSMEGANHANVAKILANMKPPMDPPQQAADDPPGYYQVTIPGAAGEAEFVYHVQLPPQYDPYRRYPCVVTLSSTGIPAKEHMKWWTGMFDAEWGQHKGQASRHGYIVVSPEWVAERQRRYEYSAREHAVVTSSLRDACRRFSIDSDRVFLSGHSAGGDAAWDIGIAHPDLWAGLIPIVAEAGKYVLRYDENARHVPMYFVSGELDGNKLATNAKEFDRYLSRVKFDVMITDYLGRGHENFQEELPRIVDWMNAHRRDFFPKEWKVNSLRPWDNFFWFAELRNFPPNSMVPPASWPPPKNTVAASITGKLQDNNGLHLDSSGAKGTIWLAPEMVDFSRRINLNGKSAAIKPSLEAMLEDVRTRGDRQHPFWARVELK